MLLSATSGIGEAVHNLCRIVCLHNSQIGIYDLEKKKASVGIDVMWWLVISCLSCIYGECM